MWIKLSKSIVLNVPYFQEDSIRMYKPIKLTTLNRCKLTTQSGGEKVSFLAAGHRQI
jgi:hypothetical protein